MIRQKSIQPTNFENAGKLAGKDNANSKTVIKKLTKNMKVEPFFGNIQLSTTQ